MNKIKFLLCFALLVSGVDGKGQVYINSYRFATTGGLLLDDYPNAGAAFSLRKLRNNFTGNCIQVLKDSTGDVTQDIGFVDNYLDTVSLKNFCKNNNCRVKTWYDQSGNERNASQSVKTYMPTIINNGVIFYRNNDVGIQFDGINDVLEMPGDSLTRDKGFINIFTYHNANSFNTGALFFSSTNIASNTRAGQFTFPTNTTLSTIIRRLDADQATIVNSSSKSINTPYLFASFIEYSNNILNQYINDTLDGTGTTSTAGNTSNSNSAANTIGALSASVNQYNGTIHEIIIYNTNQSTNRTGISNNINYFYSIY